MPRNTLLALLISVAVVLILIFIVRTWGGNMAPSTGVPVQAVYTEKVVYDVQSDVGAEALERDCRMRGGTLNACGSPCPPDAEVCAEVCAYVCELRPRPASSQSSSRIASSASESSTSSLQQEWETYRDVQSGFSIRYPQDMRVQANVSGMDGVRFQLWGPTQTAGTEVFDGINLSVRLQRYDPATVTLRQIAEADAQDAGNIGTIEEDIHPVSVANVQGYAYSADTLGLHTNYYLDAHEGEALVVSVLSVDPEDAGTYDPIAAQMLSTMKILD